MGLAVMLAVAASSVLADETIEMNEGNPADITTWGFTPAEISIPAGQSVTWTNIGSLSHTATATGGQFDTGLLDPGESSTVTLSTPGTISYQCQPHPWMKGTVIVQAAGAAPAQAVPAAGAPQAAPAAQVPTPTPFRFLTPTPVIPRTTSPTTTTTPTPPRAGGLPLELALPLLAGGVSALSGGVYLLRRGRRRSD
jgi:plastocyanin